MNKIPFGKGGADKKCGAALSYVYDEQMFYFWNFMVVLEGSSFVARLFKKA